MQEPSNPGQQIETDIKLFSPSDFARQLGIARRTFQTWRAAGKLPPPDLHIGKTVRWEEATVRSWLNEHPTDT